jgi:hypothetical protein
LPLTVTFTVGFGGQGLAIAAEAVTQVASATAKQISHRVDLDTSFAPLLTNDWCYKPIRRDSQAPRRG